MSIENKIEKSFGPVGSFAGVIIFIAGLSATIFFSGGDVKGIIVGTIVTITGAFVGFSYTSTFIDEKRKTIRYSHNVFGLLRIGKWIIIEPGMSVGINKIQILNRSYSRSNRTLDLRTTKYIVWLYDKDNKPAVPLIMKDSSGNAGMEAEMLSGVLGIPVR